MADDRCDATTTMRRNPTDGVAARRPCEEPATETVRVMTTEHREARLCQFHAEYFAERGEVIRSITARLGSRR